MDYTTQMDAARKGIITKEMKVVAEYEGIPEKGIRDLVAKGQVVIPANKNHSCLKPYGIGTKLKTKINVNLGTSKDCLDLDVEMEKVKESIRLGAESIMDLSSFGDTRKFRTKLTRECSAIIGTVPIYDAVVYYNKALKTITSGEWIDIVKMHAEDGVDFMTIHCGINRQTAERFKKAKRHTNIVSRGGSIIFAWMELTGNENPFYEYYDEILDICKEYDVTLSLGDACRPGSMLDGVIAGYIAANPDNRTKAVVAAIAAEGLCGEMAAAKVQAEGSGTSSFRMHLIDAMSNLDGKMLEDGAKIEIL